MSAEANLKALNLELPPPPKPAGVYKPVVIIGNLAYVSGHGPLKSDGTLMTGVRFFGDGIRTSSIIMQNNPHRIRFIDSINVRKGKDVKVFFN